MAFMYRLSRDLERPPISPKPRLRPLRDCRERDNHRDQTNSEASGSAWPPILEGSYFSGVLVSRQAEEP
jgi:hypothetical protein